MTGLLVVSVVSHERVRKHGASGFRRASGVLPVLSLSKGPILSLSKGPVLGLSKKGAPGLLLAELEMKAMQEVLERRRQEHRHHRQEEHAAEERVGDGEEFGRRRDDRVHRTHAGENHRGIEGRIEPGQLGEDVIAGGTDTNGGEHQRADEDSIPGEAAEQNPARWEVRRRRHDEQYTGDSSPGSDPSSDAATADDRFEGRITTLSRRCWTRGVRS